MNRKMQLTFAQLPVLRGLSSTERRQVLPLRGFWQRMNPLVFRRPRLETNENAN
jgi:hypothetical protein